MSEFLDIIMLAVESVPEIPPNEYTFTFGEIVAAISAAGGAGLAGRLVQKYLDRRKDDAETEEILNRSTRTISEIVSSSTEQLRKDFESALARINELEEQVRVMKTELDSDRQILKIRALESDLVFYQTRVQLLEGQVQELMTALRAARHEDSD